MVEVSQFDEVSTIWSASSNCYVDAAGVVVIFEEDSISLIFLLFIYNCVRRII